MQARVLPASRGWKWLTEGFALFRAAPLAWFLLVITYWVAMTAVGLVKYVGVVVASILVPALSVGFMAASRAAALGSPVRISCLAAGLRQNVGAQLALGAVYFTALAALLGATMLVDDGALARWMIYGERPAPELAVSDGFMVALSVAATLYGPVMMAFWFAPVLVAWHGQSAAKALFFSFFASLINWRAFLVYGAGAALVLLVLPSAVLLGAMLATGREGRGALLGVLFTFLLMLLPMLFASFYASYRDVFDVPDTPAAEAPSAGAASDKAPR